METKMPFSNEYPAEVDAWGEVDKQRQWLAGKSLAADIQTAIADGKSEFVIPAGNYRFHDDVGLRIEGAKHFHIKAEGVTFWFTPAVKIGVHFFGCQHSGISGLTIDMDGLPFLQGIIHDVNPVTNGIVIRLDDYSAGNFLSRPKIRGYRVMFLDADGRAETDNLDFRPSADAVRYCGQGLLSMAVDDDVAEHWAYQLHAPRQGDRVAIGLREEGGMLLATSCGQMQFRDITVFASQGFAFFEDGHGEGGNTYRNCKLIRRPGTNRLLAGAADCFHSLNQKKGPVVEECEFSWAMDDLVNIHGFFQVILDVVNDQEIVVAAPHDTRYEIGSEIRFFSPPYGQAKGKGRVVEFERLSGSGEESASRVQEYFRNKHGIPVRDFPDGNPYRVKIDRPVSVDAFDLAMTEDYCCAGAVLRNNELHDGHVRGILIKSPKSLIRDNRIERIALSAIVVKPELYWLEGPVPGDILIRNNQISDCAFGCTGLAPILVNFGFCTPPNDRFTGEKVMRDIVIEGNRICKSNAGPGILVSNCIAPRLKSNVISSPYSNLKARNVLSLRHRIDLNDQGRFGKRDMSVVDAPKYAIIFIGCEDIESSENTMHDPDKFCRDVEGVGLWCSVTKDSIPNSTRESVAASE